MAVNLIKKTMRAIKVRIAFIGSPVEPMNETGPDWSKEVKLIDEVLALMPQLNMRSDEFQQEAEDKIMANQVCVVRCKKCSHDVTIFESWQQFLNRTVATYKKGNTTMHRVAVECMCTFMNVYEFDKEKIEKQFNPEKNKASTWSREDEINFHRWMEDHDDDDFVLMNLPALVEDVLPDYVKGWTVAELVSAIRDV